MMQWETLSNNLSNFEITPDEHRTPNDHRSNTNYRGALALGATADTGKVPTLDS